MIRLQVQAIQRFTSTATAVEDLSALQDGRLTDSLSKFLVENVGGKKKKSKTEEMLVVSEPKLASTIQKTLSIPVLSDSTTQDLYRGIRQQLASLLGGLDQKDLNTMSLGLGHSMSRFKLKFSTDKVDTMVIQAIALLDDLDKEINIYSMRVKEWYGWHFPEMGKIIVDNIAYARVVKAMGERGPDSRADCRLPYQRIDHFVRDDTAGGPRSSSQGCCGALHGYRNRRYRHCAHQLALRPSHLHFRIPNSAVRVPAESNAGYSAEFDVIGRRAGRSEIDQSCGELDEPCQAPSIDGPDIRGGEGFVQSFKDET